MHIYNPPAPSPIKQLLIDEHLIIIEKPEGLLSVPGRGADKQDCVMSRIQKEFPEALNVHRLDMDTSGIMLIARNTDIQRKLGLLFQTQSINKQYIAVVTGFVNEDSGQINLPLICDWPNRPKQMVDHHQGKPALTHYKVTERNTETRTTRLQLNPKTGRTHQLRVHMQAINHPILGDRLYADKQVFQQASRLMLHASHISFIHPVTHEPVSVDSKPGF